MLFITGSLVETIGIALFIPLISLAYDGDDAKNPISIVTENVFSSVGLELSMLSVVIAMITMFSLKGLIILGQGIFSIWIVEGIKNKIRSQALKDLNYVKYTFISGKNIGFITNVITNEVEKAARAIQLFIEAIAAIIFSLVFFVSALLMGAYATLILIGVWSFLFLGIRIASKYSQELSMEKSDVDAHLNNSIVQVVQGFKYLKAVQGIPLLKPMINKLIDRSMILNVKVVAVQQLIKAIVEPLGVILILGIIYYRTEIINIEISSTIILVMFLYKVYRYGTDAQSIWNTFNSKLGGLITVDNFMRDIKEKYDSNGTKEISGVNKSILVKGVDLFLTDKKILDDVSIEIKKNTTVALVGKSGSGKTTIVDLILGIHSANKGHVAIDGVNTKDINMSKFRDKIGYVTQEPMIVNDTILNNIVLYRDNTEKTEIINNAFAAAKNAGCDFIKDKDGLNQHVGDRGVKLSGGQKQRLAIARELYKSPALLVFDEATSALDHDTEEFIQNAIIQLHGKMTIIIIAHRFTTIRDADFAYVIENGNVVEAGALQDLTLNKKSLFNKIYKIGY